MNQNFTIMMNSILELIKEQVLNDGLYPYTITTDVDDCTISIHFSGKCVYQSVFERLLKVTPLLEKESFHWQVYIDFYGALSIMIF